LTAWKGEKRKRAEGRARFWCVPEKRGGRSVYAFAFPLAAGLKKKGREKDEGEKDCVLILHRVHGGKSVVGRIPHRPSFEEKRREKAVSMK